MKKRLLLALLSFLLLPAATAVAQIGNTTMLVFPGVPSGPCQTLQLALNMTNGNLYSCDGATWSLVGGGGSTPAFSGITSGTNTSAAMVVGSGASLSLSGTGQIMSNSSWVADSMPGVPVLTCSNAGGSIVNNHTIYVRITFTTSLGESLAGPESSIATTTPNCGTLANTNTITVTAPTLPSGVLSYTVYSSDNTALAEKKQTASSNCVNLGSGVNCVITVGGAGSSVPSTNTAWLNAPSGTVNTRCPLGSAVNSWTQNASGSWDEFSAIDAQTVTPPLVAGHQTFCFAPLYFNDSGTAPFGGVKNAAFSIFHVPGATGDGTASGSTFISPAFGFIYNNTTSPSGSAAMEQHLGIYGEVDLGNNSTSCSPVGGESCASAIRGVFSDVRTSGTLSVGQPISGVTGVSFRNNAISAPVGSCQPCYTGVRGEFYNLNAANLASVYNAGVLGEISDGAAAPAGIAWSFYANMITRFSSQNGGLYISSAFSNANDYAIRSDATAKSHFSGDMNLQTVSAGGGGLPVTGGITLLSGLQSNQLANTAPAGISVINVGSAGSTAYTYKVYAKDPTGAGVPINTTLNTATGNATLNGTNFNRVTFNNANFCALGITSFDVYRTASSGTPSTTGKIGNFAITDCTGFFGVQQKFDDTGLSADGNAFPAGNTSGGVTANGFVFGKLNRYTVPSNFTTANNSSLQAITGLVVTTPTAAQNYSFHCALAYSQATANVAVAFGIQAATIAPTNIFATGTIQTNTTAFSAGTLATLATTTATNIVSATPGATATNFKAELDGTIELPAGENTINFMVSTATGTDAVTVLRGSYCELF